MSCKMCYMFRWGCRCPMMELYQKKLHLSLETCGDGWLMRALLRTAQIGKEKILRAKVIWPYDTQVFWNVVYVSSWWIWRWWQNVPPKRCLTYMTFQLLGGIEDVDSRSLWMLLTTYQFHFLGRNYDGRYSFRMSIFRMGLKIQYMPPKRR
jgi:hypothetical protein